MHYEIKCKLSKTTDCIFNNKFISVPITYIDNRYSSQLIEFELFPCISLST